jgi:hypothetical protein
MVGQTIIYFASVAGREISLHEDELMKLLFTEVPPVTPIWRVKITSHDEGAFSREEYTSRRWEIKIALSAPEGIKPVITVQ